MAWFYIQEGMNYLGLVPMADITIVYGAWSLAHIDPFNETSRVGPARVTNTHQRICLDGILGGAFRLATIAMIIGIPKG